MEGLENKWGGEEDGGQGLNIGKSGGYYTFYTQIVAALLGQTLGIITTRAPIRANKLANS